MKAQKYQQKTWDNPSLNHYIGKDSLTIRQYIEMMDISDNQNQNPCLKKTKING